MRNCLLALALMAFATWANAQNTKIGSESGRWAHLKKDIEELKHAVASQTDEATLDRLKRQLQTKTRTLRNTRLLDQGLPESEFRRLNQLQAEMDAKRHVMRQVKFSKDPRARITDAQREEIKELAQKIRQIQGSVIRAPGQTASEVAARNAIKRIRDQIRQTEDPRERRKLQQELRELMEHQHSGNPRPGRSATPVVSPQRLQQIRTLREKISNMEDGPEKTALRIKLKQLYDHNNNNPKPPRIPRDRLSRRLTREQQLRVDMLRKQQAAAPTMEQKLNFRHQIKAIYDSVR